LIKVVLNVFLIPRYGVLGAAYATVASYSLLTISITVFSARLLPIRWPLRRLAVYLIAAALATVLAAQIPQLNMLLSFLLKATVAVISYVAVTLALVPELRASVGQVISRVRKQFRERN